MKEYLAKLLKALAEKNQVMQAALSKSAEAGTTPDEATEAEIQGLEKDIAAINLNIERTKKQIQAIESAEVAGLTPVEGQSEQGAKNTAEGKKEVPRIQVESNLPKGIGFAQFARAKFAAQIEAKKGNYVSPLDMAKQMGFNAQVQDLVQKATVGSTSDPNFAAALVRDNHLVGEFVDMLKAATIFDKLTGMRNVPFNTIIPSKTKRGKASWVGQGKRKPMTNPEFGDVKITEHKLAAITAYNLELVRRSDPAVDELVRDDLIEASQILIDETFVGSQAQTDEIPAGMLNGVPAIDATGVTAAAYDADLQLLEDKFLEANLSLDGSYYLMSETRASRMGRLRDALGNYYFQGMQGVIKELNGRPVITSQTVGETIQLIKTSEILLAQDGGVDVSYSDQATLENTDGTIINLWQENKFAVRVEKFITWAKRRPIAAAWIDYSKLP
ncbi:phage major capsid protein [Acinetobacter sichuanensis]|uniref:phage major capsid protein n=1 Tax=Acinetobacter sichuanensis TaxID=2136183 RepID=UPI002810855B|nr:phage major capsid protein [Acinetobacter sichuanensis]MDQ9019908.1 phage major capsid protein [Acinetobacter sichuanensis]